ncbi:glycoside hydrolase superfamily [Apiosordaria backusii]|uniref:Beta-glucosidase cel3A n=1 Tax=Apiosordaria backusii TaxID=314023 RepID=A0AA40BT52_9PEZI|nr:glycoside hydrolase superfamily [Apiosordaria backusii]
MDQGEIIQNDEYFYGGSEPVYPSPEMTGSGGWKEAFDSAKEFVGKMTLDEKISLTAGANSETSCPGFLPAISRLKFPGMCLADAGQGVRGTDFVSSWPSGIHVGASWNKELTLARGKGMGGEFRTKGVNILLGPVVGPAGRVVSGGRNWEGFASDPYLSGVLVGETVKGVQGVGVIASTKHFVANEQETNRNPGNGAEAVSSNIDDRTMHEIYLWPFQDAVRAGTGSIMCSYQRVNNSYGCANSKTQNGLLKTELGFQGGVVSDWGAQHAGVATAEAGMDMAMPNGGDFWGSHLKDAIKNGTVPESRLDDMVIRTIASWYQMGQDKDFPGPGVGMPKDLTKPHRIVDARNSSFKSTLFDGAVEGHVLVKNIRKALPLKTPKLLSIYGYSAKNPDENNPTDGLSPWLMGSGSFDYQEFGAGFFGWSGATPGTTGIAFNGTLYSGGGSGATSQSLAISPYDAIIQQAYEDDTALFWDFHNGKPAVDPVSSACLVLGNAWAAEGADRPGLRDDYTDDLILHVASQCNNTVVIFHNAGIRLVEEFIDHPNVTAVIFAHLPGQASGKALVSILYGKENPSGKLPYTVARNESDYGNMLRPDQPEGIFRKFPQSNFTEGVFVDYRHFDENKIKPRFEFGFGLSYTTFRYANLAVEKDSNKSFEEFPKGKIVEGGQEDLWDVLVRVEAEVENNGEVEGKEVAQLYLGIPETGREGEKVPVRQLRGFEKVSIGVGETKKVVFELTRRDLSVWDVRGQKWRLGRGEFKVEVGGSSRDLPLVGKFTV